MEFFVFANSAQYIMIFTSDSVVNILSVSMIVGAICFALVYAFEACALYTIAKRGGYKNRWMAFVPIVNTYYIGVLSDKNRFSGLSSRAIALIAAIVEGIYFVLSLLDYTATFTLAAQGYVGISYSTAISGGMTVSIPNGFEIISAVPASLYWAEWMATYIGYYFMSWADLVYLVVSLMLLILFFQTYAARHYILFAICCILFPVKGILFFIVRKNKGKNYRDYLREQQAKQYRMYQESIHRQEGNPYNYNPYSGRTQAPPQGNPYQNASSSSAPSDPFDEFGSSSGSSSSGHSRTSEGNGGGDNSDPFGDL